MFDKAFESLDRSMKTAQISMMPLIDMVFILLIFFVVTTTFTKETGITVDKARATTSQIIHKNLLLVAIDRAGRYWYDKQCRSADEIVQIAARQLAKSDDVTIVLVPDKDGRVEPLITVMDKLRAHNITRFSLGTRMGER